MSDTSGSDTPAHDWLKPRLEQLIEQAAENGIERTVAVAVLTDLITGSDMNGGHLAGDTDA